MGEPVMAAQVELYACLFVRDFPVQALLRLRPELRNRSVAVLDGEPPLQFVHSCNSTATAVGVAHGMTTVELETFQSVTVLRRSLAEEASTKQALLECAGNFSPRVEDRSSGCHFACVIDIAGTEKLLGRSEAPARSLLARVKAIGIIGSVAISKNFYAAYCVASSGPSIAVIEHGQESQALASLPIAVLDISEAQAETFSLWGIETLGMLAALPERELIARMGQEGKRLRLLARGELPHLFQPVEPR
jgi:protein ImuB